VADEWEPVLAAVPALGSHTDAIRAEFAPWQDRSA
jgi:hypothetical protein